MKYVEIAYRYETSPAVHVPRPPDAPAARKRLEAGSHAFAALLAQLTHEGVSPRRVVKVDAADLGLGVHDPAGPVQRPYAAIVGCSDARVPVELIFSEGPNDLFVVRVAGNALGSDVLGSLKYAVDHLGKDLKLIVVLGHSGCGALSAAVDVFLNPSGYMSLLAKHGLRQLVDRLLIVVHTCAKRMVAHFGAEITANPGYRDALIEISVVTNAALAAHTIQQEIGDADPHGLKAVYGVYVLSTREIWAPTCSASGGTGLADPPLDADAFRDLGDAVMDSPRIAALLHLEGTPQPPQ